MSSTSRANGAAPDAGVDTGGDEAAVDAQAQREVYAEQAEQAVKTIKAKIAGMKETLATAEADAKRLRAEAKGGR